MLRYTKFHPGSKLFGLLLAWIIILLSGCQTRNTPMSPAKTQTPGPNLSELESFSAASISETQEYIVHEQLVLVNEGPGAPSKQNLWIALISDIHPYQNVLRREITPENYRLFTDEYGNQIAEFDFSRIPPGTEIEIHIEYLVSVNRLEYDLSDCKGIVPDSYTQPELHIESNNPQIIALAEQLSADKPTVCDQVRAFYDYIGENLVYSYNGNNWGAQAALGEMGADCTEFASLMIALSRAAGVPARYMEGVLFLGNTPAELARTEHAWLEVYLPGAGWTPIDPTLGRSSIFRDQNFAAYTPDHIIVSRGRHPSTLRGASYYSHLYWPGTGSVIKINDFGWSISRNE